MVVIPPRMPCCTLALADDDARGDAAGARAVEWGRRGLTKAQSFPWYDSQADGLKRIELREAPPPQNYGAAGRGIGKGLDAALQGLAWGLLALILIALAALFVRQWLRSRREGPAAGGAAPTPAAEPQIGLLPAEVDPRRGDLLAETRRAAAAGDYARAVACLFGHQLLRLDQRRIIRLARGKTNRQYLREAAVRPALPAALQPTMVAFEDAFFGRQPMPRERFEACWAELPRFERLCAEADV